MARIRPAPRRARRRTARSGLRRSGSAAAQIQQSEHRKYERDEQIAGSVGAPDGRLAAEGVERVQTEQRGGDQADGADDQDADQLDADRDESQGAQPGTESDRRPDVD